jgi:predicted nucleic acid-binding protein
VIVVDSSVWIDLLNGEATPPVLLLRSLRERAPVLVGDLILLKVLQGFRSEREARLVERAMRRFPIEPMLDADLAVLAASHYRLLRAKRVTPRKTVDLVIATFCIARGHTLLHADRDFAPMAAHLGLRVLAAG